jgi:hypothetical protein
LLIGSILPFALHVHRSKEIVKAWKSIAARPE